MNLTDLADGQLLTRFLEAEDTAAFDELFRRHAPTVLRICQRAAGRTVDADDVLQTVFLTLADKAATLTTRASIAGWLYRVAWHTGSRHRRAAVTRQRHERRAAAEAGAAVTGNTDPVLASEMQYELEDAVAKLPEAYGDSIVLHHFHGLTVLETAKLLGESPGTVASNLSRGRHLLRDRMAKRGLVLTAGAVAVVLGQSALQMSAISISLPAISPSIGLLSAAGASGAGGAGVSSGFIAATIGSVCGSFAKSASVPCSIGRVFFWTYTLIAALGVTATVGTFQLALARGENGDGRPQSLYSYLFPESSAQSSAAAKSQTVASIDSGTQSASTSSSGYSSGSGSVPEPGSILLLAGGSLTLILRRRARPTAITGE